MDPKIFHQQVVKVNTTEQHNRREWGKKKKKTKHFVLSFWLTHMTHSSTKHTLKVQAHIQFLIIHNFPPLHHHPVSLRLLRRVCVCVHSCDWFIRGAVTHGKMKPHRAFLTKLQTLILVFTMCHSYQHTWKTRHYLFLCFCWNVRKKSRLFSGGSGFPGPVLTTTVPDFEKHPMCGAVVLILEDSRVIKTRS